jgi:type II secretory pathway component GspD/PulD (secretin)
VKKTTALLILIGLLSAVSVSGQESTGTPTNTPMGALEPTGASTATPAPGRGSSLKPPVALPSGGMTHTPTPSVDPMDANKTMMPSTRVPQRRSRGPSMPPADGSLNGSGPGSTVPSAPNKTAVPLVNPNDSYVALNFTNVDISALVKVMSELTRRNFILDERVTGKVTIMTPTKISQGEAYQVLLSALEIKGFTALEDGQVMRIIPSATARQSGLKVYQDSDMKGEGFATKLIRLRYVNPQEIVHAITPLMTKDGSVIAYAPTDSLILTDSVSNIRKIESLIRAMDVAAPEGRGKINVYYLKNASAEDIAKLTQALVSRLPAPTAAGMPHVAGPSTILEGAVTITADKATNSLIIVASPGDYETMKDMIQKLDIRRRQVYVEAAIIEMSLAKSRELGFEFQATNLNQLDNNQTNVVGGTNFGNIGTAMSGPAGLATLNGLNVGAVKGTFTFNGTTFLNIGALLHALQTDGDVNVLSTPNILTMDNQKAKIMVGENIPFITGQTQNAATGSAAILTSVDRKDVGISLEITPQITSDDSVRLEIKQEISDITTTPGLNPNIVGPSTSKRSADTTVVVKDRQTMVIGGLIRDNLVTTTSKVPLLGDIPILGWLFKYKTTQVAKTNLMIFITPYIIKNEVEAIDLTKRKNESQDNFRKEYRIQKKGALPAFQPKTGEAAEQPVPEMKKDAAPLQTAPTTSSKTMDLNQVPQSVPTSTTPSVPQGGAR